MEGEPCSSQAPVKIYRIARHATFLRHDMGELAGHGAIENAMPSAQQPVSVGPRLKIGLDGRPYVAETCDLDKKRWT